MSSHQDTVYAQFDPRAAAYLDSPVHAQGPDLRHACELVAGALPAHARALDIGCGAGHLAFALAPQLGSVVALDASASMLAQVDAQAAARGLPGISTVRAGAEALPFGDARFELVATRYSAHHWSDLGAAMAQARRVLAPGGYLLVIDLEAPADALVDTHLQTIELLRDRSHVRNRSDAQWRALIAGVGLELLEFRSWPTRLEFASWVARMRTPQPRAAMVRDVLAEAPAEVRQALKVEPDGSFEVSTGLWWARAPAA